MLRTTRRVLACLTIAVLALAGSGCDVDPATKAATATPTVVSTSGARHSFDPTPADFLAVRHVLDRRAAAINAHRLRDFLATVDPQATESFSDLQRAYFDNLRLMDATRVGYAMENLGVDRAPVPGDPDAVFAPLITEHLLLAGTDRRALGDTVGYTFVRREGRWYVGAELGDHGPWSGGPVAVSRHHGLLVVIDDDLADRLPALASAIDIDLRSVSALLGRTSDSRILVDATSTGEAVKLNSSDGLEASAVSFSVRGYGPDNLPAGSRIKINPASVAELIGNTALLRHELTHFVLREYSGLVPLWLSEGVAEYVGYYPNRIDDLAVNSIFHARLMESPQDIPVVGVFGLDAIKNYMIANAAATWLIDRYGMPRLLKLMDAYRRQLVEPYHESATAQVLRRVDGTSPAALRRGTFSLLARMPH